MGSKRRAWLLATFALLVVMLFSACAKNAPQDFTDPVGPAAEKSDNLYQLVFWVAVGVFVIVEGLLFFAVFRFRQRRGRERQLPAQTHGNSRLEIGWTIAPALVLAVIAVPTVATIFDLSAEPEGNVLQINVTGHQWWWEVEYPESGVLTANEIHIPTGRPVRVTLTSFDVIHSFWVPKLAGKQDVVPGAVRKLTIQSDEPGVFNGQCMEYCGLSHANMRLVVIAQPEQEFQAWATAQQQPGLTPAVGSQAEAGQKVFLGGACVGCHAIGGTSAAGRIGPDLTHFAARSHFAGAIFQRTPENVAAWLKDPPGRKTGAKMPNLNLSDEQIAGLVAYLESLK